MHVEGGCGRGRDQGSPALVLQYFCGQSRVNLLILHMDLQLLSYTMRLSTAVLVLILSWVRAGPVKREIVEHHDGLFYHLGPYMSHSAGVRQSPLSPQYQPLPQRFTTQPVYQPAQVYRQTYQPVPAITFLDSEVLSRPPQREPAQTVPRLEQQQDRGGETGMMRGEDTELVKPVKEKSAALQRLMAIAGVSPSADTEKEAEFVCPAAEGHFPSPASCSVYYQCAQARPVRRDCGPGLAYNQDTNQCDWRENVTC